MTANTDTTSAVTDNITITTDPYLAPFQAAIRAGTTFVMMSRAINPKVDPGPAAFSSTVIGSLLRWDRAIMQDRLRGGRTRCDRGRVGVPHDVEIDGQTTFYRSVGLRGGPAPTRAYQPELLARVLDGSIDPGSVFAMVVDLDHIAEAHTASTNDAPSRRSSRSANDAEQRHEIHTQRGTDRSRPADWFTGTVQIDGIRNPDEQSAVGCAHVRFHPAPARPGTTTPKGQTLYVTDGIGLVATRAGVQETRPYDVIYIEPGEEHWHGATPERFMAHVAMQEADQQGQVVTWLDHVTDAEYDPR